MRVSSFSLVCLSLLTSLTAALPGGCPGNLTILSTNSSRVPLLWACSPVNVKPMFGSGQNALLETYTTSSDVQCANACAPLYAMAAFWYPNTTTCECWEIGDITGTVDYEEGGATWIDLYWSPPGSAHNWGLFTCPEGSYSGAAAGSYGFCESVNIYPAKPALNVPCVSCRYYGQYYVSGPNGWCGCYDDLAGLKVTYNYSSEYIVYDYYDFTATPVTSTTTSKSSTSTTLIKLITTTSNKSSSKSTSSTKPTIKSTSKSDSKVSTSTKTTTSSTKSSSSTKSTSKLSSKTTSSTSKTSSTKKTQSSITTSTRMSSKTSTHTSTTTQ